MMSRANEIELVVTTPSTHTIENDRNLSFRSTQGSILQLITTAESSLFLLSPFMQSLEGVDTSLLVEALRYAVVSGVELSVVTSPHGINTIKQSWVSILDAGSVTLYSPSPSLDNPEILGSHAKVVLADKSRAYIGSANITLPGLHNNLEVGVCLDGDIPVQLSYLFLYLIDTGFFVRV